MNRAACSWKQVPCTVVPAPIRPVACTRESDAVHEQLDRLLELAKRPHLTIQIVPFAAGVGPAMGQSFLIAEFPDSPTAFHVDSLAADLDASDTVEAVATYKLRFDHLRALTLPDDASSAMIAARVEGLRGHG